MKRIIIIAALITICTGVQAQVMYIAAGANFFTQGNGNIVIHKSNLVNLSNLADFSGCILQMSGNTDNTIGGTFTTVIKQLTVNKTGKKLSLSGNLQINELLEFQAGILDLNGANIALLAPATISGENETRRITGDAGGEISTTANLNNPNSINPGKLGITFTSTGSTGLITIRRGHLLQSNTGDPFGIKRYYQIDAPAGATYNGILRFKYLDAELMSTGEANLQIWSSNNNGISWFNRSFSSKSVTENYIESATLTQFERYTFNDPLPGFILKNSNSAESISITNNNTLQLQVFPNPITGNHRVFAKIIAEKEMNATIVIYAGNGAPLQSIKINITKGINFLPLATENFVPGNYIIKLIMENGAARSAIFIKQ